MAWRSSPSRSQRPWVSRSPSPRISSAFVLQVPAVEEQDEGRPQVAHLGEGADLAQVLGGDPRVDALVVGLARQANQPAGVGAGLLDHAAEVLPQGAEHDQGEDPQGDPRDRQPGAEALAEEIAHEGLHALGYKGSPPPRRIGEDPP
jgi:hypothetical protein